MSQSKNEIVPRRICTPLWQQEGPASDGLNFKQLYKDIFLDLLHNVVLDKAFPHTKVPNLIYMSL